MRKSRPLLGSQSQETAKIQGRKLDFTTRMANSPPTRAYFQQELLAPHRICWAKDQERINCLRGCKSSLELGICICICENNMPMNRCCNLSPLPLYLRTATKDASFAYCLPALITPSFARPGPGGHTADDDLWSKLEFSVLAKTTGKRRGLHAPRCCKPTATTRLI